MTASVAPSETTPPVVESAWDRESGVWRNYVGGEPVRGAQGRVLAYGTLDEARDAAAKTVVRPVVAS